MAGRRSLTLDVPPRSIPGQSQHRLSSRHAHEQVRQLHRNYKLLSEGDIIAEALQQFPTLYALLAEAVEPLRLTFGNDKLRQLEALESDEGIILRVTVQLAADTKSPAELMRSFKRNWWLKNCSRSEASLVFDYETGDGL